jgi:hypothetical protein
MAMTELVGVFPDEDGFNPDPMDAANVDGYFFNPQSGRFEIEIANAGGAQITATLPTPFTGGVNALADNAIAVPNNERRLIRIKPENLQYYLDTNPTTGQERSVVKLTFSSVTGVTCQLRYFY